MERAAARQQHGCPLRPCLTAVAWGAYMPGIQLGRMAEWLCRGLQILVQRFDSASGLQPIFR